ncbi:histidine phosphatase family protein [Actinophytocola oryzae]|uniref:Broad specificity phosphatase PhoE n=1 Tax=Actinophytocola oryzae TaxID=502181 RepID=A0A4R7VQG6_9PSEU|nr:histidine phosphatase family protein [Actinophytocola oryzae]TDV51993.1 broad specificity phosphatase PhoE [Actinophytocola oryzae]
MTAVYLLRHGQASFGAADYDTLSAVGRQQAAVLGTELGRREVDVHAAWSGTLRRQLATASACLESGGFDLPVREDARWNEYDHLGLVPAGQPAPSESRDFQRQLDVAIESWITGGHPAGSTGTWLEFTGGVRAALAEVFDELPRGKAALVFTSAGVISAICAALLSAPTAGYLALNRTMPNAAITKLVSGRSGVSLVSVNEHGHFEGPHRGLLTYR